MGVIIIGLKEIIIKLILALFAGGITGIEREKSHQYAGFRTHILVSVGSCMISMTSLDLFTLYSASVNMDPARLPAQVLSGIGFLGAGAILKTSNGVRGLTTAAGLWATACIGITIGYGQYKLGLSAWFFVMCTLYILKKFDNILFSPKETILNVIVNDIRVISILYEDLNKEQIIVKNLSIECKDENYCKISFFIAYDRRLTINEFINELKKMENVIFIDFLY